MKIAFLVRSERESDFRREFRSQDRCARGRRVRTPGWKLVGAL